MKGSKLQCNVVRIDFLSFLFVWLPFSLAWIHISNVLLLYFPRVLMQNHQFSFITVLFCKGAAKIFEYWTFFLQDID